VPLSGIEIKVMLVSFIWVLALTRILESFGTLWVARKRVRFAASQMLWMTAMLIDILGNWLAVSGFTDRAPAWVFVAILFYSLGLFFAAAVVSPKIPADGVLDLAVYETEEGGAYKVTFIVLMLLAFPLEYGQSTSLGPISLAAYVKLSWSTFATLAVFAAGLTRNTRIRTAAAIAALMLAIYGLAINLVWMAMGLPS
jgi:hypothetical protein